MPIYEFVCDNCGEKFTTLCKVGEGATCPKCGQEARRIFSPFVISSKEGTSSTASTSSCATCSLPSCKTCGR